MSDDAHDPCCCNVAAVKVIQANGRPKYSAPRLKEGHGEATTYSKKSRVQRERRKRERGYYEELSRYYLVPGGSGTWKRRPLLLEGKHGSDRSTC